jgi:hypothetical protein
MKYSPSVFFAPLSIVANTPRMTLRLHALGAWKPASSASRRIMSQPCAMPTFSAAIEPTPIHSCSRLTDSSCRRSISW